MTSARTAGWIVFLALSGQAAGQGHAPHEAAKHMTVPAGFCVELVASEPDVRQPVAIDFDERGRLWVLQYLQYPNPAGLRRVIVDRYSRTVYDRVPEPPPKGPKGADRLTILEPIPGQPGKHRTKDFVSGLNLASGFAFGHDGVFVLQAPYLLFYPDRNRDDVPDADPDVLLTGFGMEDAHSVANSLTWGPDGWLYGCQGSTVTAKIRNPAKPTDPPMEFQQGVWRYHPLSRRFELFCEGGGNSWGLDFDRDGHLFYSTNHGGHVLLHGVQGGYYWKSFGKHGNLHNPYAYGYFEHAPHQNFKGGHVTVGGIVYQGDAYPPEFRGKYIAADLLGHAVYWHDLLADGSTFRTRHGGELLLANDTWFAPSDVTLGPDGCVYVADWHDQRMAHPDPDAEWDRRNGRVFRIGHASARPHAAIDLGKMGSAELVKLLDHPNGWHARTARRILAARRDPEVILPLRSRVLEAKDPHVALNALWALYVSGGFDEALGRRLLHHTAPGVRYWALRLLGDESRVEESTVTQLMILAGTEPQLAVCSQLACTARRLSATQALPILAALIKRAGIERDPHLPLLIWWGMEGHLPLSADSWIDVFDTNAARKTPIIASILVPRTLRRLLATSSNEGWQKAHRAWLAAAPETQKAALPVIETALIDHPMTSAITFQVSGQWSASLRGGSESPSKDSIVRGILIRLNDQIALSDAWTQVRSTRVEPAMRAELIRTLATAPSGGSWLFLGLINPTEPAIVQAAALEAVQRYDEPAIAKHLVDVYRRSVPAIQSRIRSTLLFRPSWAVAFVLAVDSGRIPSKEIAIEELRTLAATADHNTKALIRKHWGAPPETTPEEKLAEVRRLNNDLRAGAGDARAGRAHYKQHCAACHTLFDEGIKVGPDLTTANRFDRDYLLVSIVDPNAVIRREYLTHVIQTKDGRSLSGVIVDQSPTQVTLFTAAKERVSVQQRYIDEMNPSDVSLMPENLLKSLKPQELRDLFAYLQAKSALPK